ncbi:M23 family metallopeptidase [Maritimibacter fusiformis]|uniref:M23 family metallopeptidase n=2 Tax=Maritimibacter fusiformis TaxID=2603819 RepID=A0A5D0RJJ6_9RHOB|nr:M23 family metallopeptidase [Maritimibacter fusiformis]
MERAMAKGLLALCALAALGACGDRSSYGHSAPYMFHMRDKIPVAMPANAPSIAQQFMTPKTEDGQGHYGIDVADPPGSPVIAAAAGTVYLSYFEPMYGNRIVIDHGPDANGRRVFTHYKHLDVRQVEAGARVVQGQQIGTLGETGVLSSYAHLHFEVSREKSPGARRATGDNYWQGMVPQDPQLYWANGVGQVTCAGSVTGNSGPMPLVYPVACG